MNNLQRVQCNENVLKFWTYCTGKAVALDTWVPVMVGRGCTEVLLTPGQLIYGRNRVSKEVGIKSGTLRSIVAKLEKWGMISVWATHQYSTITILES